MLLLAACGGSGSHAEKPKPPEKPDPYWEWHKAEPKSPEQPLRTTRFQPPQQCGQGPYRLMVETMGAPLSESMHVTICTPHGFKGSVSYRPPQHDSNESGFGDDDKHHDRCRADVSVVATPGTASGSSSAAGKPGARGKPAAGAPAKVQPVELRGELIATGEKCPDGQQSISIVNHGYSGGDEPGPNAPPPLPKGPFVIEIWSELPNDLTGVSFLVEQRGVPAGYDVQQWTAYRKAWNDWYKRHDEALAQAIANGHAWKTVERPAATKQPPPARAEAQPPRPSPNASWIPGYWQFTDGWVWSAGFWRVPQQDIEQEKTVEAPAPPPPPKAEPAPSSEVAYHTARRAVWTPGYWMWNGSGYVWIAGAWRIPDGAEMTWVAPTWRPSRRGTSIYVPGGFVRIRTRR